MEGKSDDLSSVGVAVRVRPLNNSEKAENSQGCVTIDYKDKLIIMGKDRSFTFDRVYGIDSKQEDIFEGCTKDLVLSVFGGYNATVLAYGQTGSGKTFTMGSGQVTNIKEEDIGIIPRVIRMIFNEVDRRKQQAEFNIKVSFLEIYNEEIHDLLESNSMVPEKPISIREDKGSIFLMGLHEEKVMNCEEMHTCLERGTLQRIVASTQMNASSSRSHAIFTINIEQQVIEVQPEVTDGQEYMMAKFHFVDLAGSERAKRTGASGNTLREGISINKGLLCLGNVISALTEELQKKNHVPYRDSKLTRILQDSLGGNAKTYMIACISPAEINFEETLNTLKYASRARNIKNKPVINRDPQSAIISQLKQEVQLLKQEIKTYQKVLSSSGNEDFKMNFELLKRDYSEEDTDEAKINKLKVQQLEKKLAQFTNESEVSKNILNDTQLELLQLTKERDLFKKKLEKYGDILKENHIFVDDEDESSIKLIDEYNDIIEKLKRNNQSKDVLISELQTLKENLNKQLERESKLLQKKTEELEELKRRKINGKDDISGVLIKNVDNYGRMFAETIMATISRQDSIAEAENEEQTDEGVEEVPIHDIDNKPENEELEHVEGKIKENEEILKNIEDAFRTLQSKLIEEMSNQYYKKIEELEIEKKNTERDRDLALEKMKEGSSSDKQAVSDKFKTKIQLLEEKLKENKNKDKELTNLQKQVESQKAKLSKLDEEIRKAKTEKIRLQNGIKEKNEEIQKCKAQKQKEILLIKKNSLKKDQEIQFLKSENRKKDNIAKKKTEEMAAIQRRQKEVANRKKHPIQTINVDILKQWVQEYTAAVIDEREMTLDMNQEIEEREEFEKELAEINSLYSEKKLKIERFELILSDNEPGIDQDELYSTTHALALDIQDDLERIDILENKINRKNELILGYSNALANSRVEDIKSRALTISTLEDSHNLVTVLFDEVLSRASEIKKYSKIILSKDAEIENKQAFIKQAEREMQMIIKKYEGEIQKLKADFKVKEFVLLDELSSLKNISLEETPRKLTGDDKDLQEGNDTPKEPKLGKSTSELRPEEEKIRGKVVPFITLSKARESVKKKKPVEEEEKKIRKSPLTSRNTMTPRTPSDDSIIARSTNKSRNYLDIENPKKLQKWKLTNNIEAQKGAIYSMVTNENILYTGSNQMIKV